MTEMKKLLTDEGEALRRERNLELVRRMRNGESLTSFDSQASWFPPRPTIKKDAEALGKLYSSQASESPQTASTQQSNVVVPLRRN